MFWVAAEGGREFVYSGIRFMGFCIVMVWKKRKNKGWVRREEVQIRGKVRLLGRCLKVLTFWGWCPRMVGMGGRIG